MGPTSTLHSQTRIRQNRGMHMRPLKNGQRRSERGSTFPLTGALISLPRLWPVQTKAHSPRTCARPRSRKRVIRPLLLRELATD